MLTMNSCSSGVRLGFFIERVAQVQQNLLGHGTLVRVRGQRAELA
jgi:hypothetical protein